MHGHSRWELARLTLAVVVVAAVRLTQMHPQANGNTLTEVLLAMAAGVVFTVLIASLKVSSDSRTLSGETPLQTRHLSQDSGLRLGVPSPPRGANSGMREAIERLELDDPSFSEFLLLDWVADLVGQLSLAQHDPEKQQALRPFVAPLVWHSLTGHLGESAPPTPGQGYLQHVTTHGNWHVLTVHQPVWVPQANGGAWLQLVLTLKRAIGARSPDPSSFGFDCPVCAQPVKTSLADGQCLSCEMAIAHGQFSWQVTGLEGLHALQPSQTPTVSTDDSSARRLPVVAHNLEACKRGLLGRHPEVDFEALRAVATDAVHHWFEHLKSGTHAAGDSADASGARRALFARASRNQALALQITASAPDIHHASFVRVGRDGWFEFVDLHVRFSIEWVVRDSSGAVIEGTDGGPCTTALYVRLAHPSMAQTSVSGWRCQQILRPAEYCP